MGEKMTLERLREHLRSVTVSHGFTTNYDAFNEGRKSLAHEMLGLMAHLTQPAQAVDVDAVRAVIEQTREYYERTDDRRTAYALENVLSDIYETLTAALTRNTQEH